MLEIGLTIAGLKALVVALVIVIGFMGWKWFLAAHRANYAANVLDRAVGGIPTDTSEYERLWNLRALLKNTNNAIVDDVHMVSMPLDDVLLLSKQRAKANNGRTKADAKLIRKLAKQVLKSRLQTKQS